MKTQIAMKLLRATKNKLLFVAAAPEAPVESAYVLKGAGFDHDTEITVTVESRVPSEVAAT